MVFLMQPEDDRTKHNRPIGAAMSTTQPPAGTHRVLTGTGTTYLLPGGASITTATPGAVKSFVYTEPDGAVMACTWDAASGAYHCVPA